MRIGPDVASGLAPRSDWLVIAPPFWSWTSRAATVIEAAGPWLVRDWIAAPPLTTTRWPAATVIGLAGPATVARDCTTAPSRTEILSPLIRIGPLRSMLGGTRPPTRVPGPPISIAAALDAERAADAALVVERRAVEDVNVAAKHRDLATLDLAAWLKKECVIVTVPPCAGSKAGLPSAVRSAVRTTTSPRVATMPRSGPRAPSNPRSASSMSTSPPTRSNRSALTGSPPAGVLIANRMACAPAPRKPKASGGALVRTAAGWPLALKMLPSLRWSSSAVDTCRAPGTSIWACSPNATPFGLMSHRSAFGISERSRKVPSMSEGSFFPVTRAITCSIGAGPRNVAVSPAGTLKR